MRAKGVIAPCDLAPVRTLLHPWNEPGPLTRLVLVKQGTPPAGVVAHPDPSQARIIYEGAATGSGCPCPAWVWRPTIRVDTRRSFRYSESRHKG